MLSYIDACQARRLSSALVRKLKPPLAVEEVRCASHGIHEGAACRPRRRHHGRRRYMPLRVCACCVQRADGARCADKFTCAAKQLKVRGASMR